MLSSASCTSEPGGVTAADSCARERREYRFRQVISHLSSAAAWPQLFDLLETRPFLADQADFFGGFEATGEDIERYALAAAIGVEDWDRFLRYASLALNLRGLAETLAAPEILRALAQGNRLRLARDIVDRLAELPRRAEARAFLAAACGPASELFPELVRGVEEDLEMAAPTSAVLATNARCLGLELAVHWQRWTARLQ